MHLTVLVMSPEKQRLVLRAHTARIACECQGAARARDATGAPVVCSFKSKVTLDPYSVTATADGANLEKKIRAINMRIIPPKFSSFRIF